MEEPAIAMDYELIGVNNLHHSLLKISKKLSTPLLSYKPVVHRLALLDDFVSDTGGNCTIIDGSKEFT